MRNKLYALVRSLISKRKLVSKTDRALVKNYFIDNVPASMQNCLA